MSSGWNNQNMDYGQWGSQPDKNNNNSSGAPTLVWVTILLIVSLASAYLIYVAKSETKATKAAMEVIQVKLEEEIRVRVELEIQNTECEVKLNHLTLNQAAPGDAMDSESEKNQAEETSENPFEEVRDADNKRGSKKSDDLNPTTQRPIKTQNAQPPSDPNRKLTKEDVQPVLRKSFSKIRACARESDHKGQMNVKFVIKPDGTVSNAICLSPGFSAKTEKCVLKVVSNLKFLPHEGDVPVTYPFLIQ